MLVAFVKLKNKEDSFLEVRGVSSISWEPHHVVINMADGTIESYRAEDVITLSTVFEEEEDKLFSKT